jgi:hypothetical protein
MPESAPQIQVVEVPSILTLPILVAEGNEYAIRAVRAYYRMMGAPLGSKQRRHERRTYDRNRRKALNLPTQKSV